jgi:hypothetical protein
VKRGIAFLVVLALLFVAGCWPDPNPDPTPTPGPTPNPGPVVFFDDFEDGADPGWDLTVGWDTSSGFLLHGRGTSTAQGYVRGGADWSDYAVEATVDPRNGDLGILARCSEDLQSYVLVYGEHDDIRLSVYIDGDYFDGSEILRPGLYAGEQQMRVEVEGSEVRVYLNGNLRITFSGIPLLTGMPGVYSHSNAGSLSDRPRFDNFRVTELD